MSSINPCHNRTIYHRWFNLVVRVTVFDASLRNTTMQSIVCSELKAERKSTVCNPTVLCKLRSKLSRQENHPELKRLKDLTYPVSESLNSPE